MKSAYKFIFIFTVLLAFQATTAQEQLSPKEQAKFKVKVIAKANETRSIVSDFIQEKHLSVFNDVSISKGKMVFLNPDKISWEYIEPYKNTIIFKEGKLYVNENGETSTIDLNTNKLFMDFNQLIIKGIKGNMFDDEMFEISYFKNPENYMVRFVPKDEQLKGFIETLELKFDKSTAEVLELKMIEDTEDFTLIRFLNRVTNVKIKDGVFEL